MLKIIDMKKILTFVFTLALVASFMGTANAETMSLFGLPEWEELEVAAERVDIEISRTRPIPHEDLIEILESYIEILEERLEEILSRS